MNIALIGPPGAGKGTHAEFIAEEHKLVHLSTGVLFREHVTDQTELGLIGRKYMRRGALVPDEIVDAMVEERVRTTDSTNGILFDGFPRTMYQTQFLDNLFDELEYDLNAVIYLNVSADVIVARLQGRETCSVCQTPYHTSYRPPKKAGLCDKCGGKLHHRDDDQPEIARHRLATSHHSMEQLIVHYRQAGKLIIVDGDDLIPIVRITIGEHIERIQAGNAQFSAERKTKLIKTPQRVTPILTDEVANHTQTNLVILGGPGSGKGTQSALLREHLGLPHVATGDLFRDNLRNQTALGKMASAYMKRGELVPDDLTFSMVHERLQQPDTSNGFILDGFPRNLHQAQNLTDMIHTMKRNISCVFYIQVSDEEILRRVSGRMICHVCQTPFHLEFNPPHEEGLCDTCGGELYQRDDDNFKTVQDRLKNFHRGNRPLVDYYRNAGILKEIQGQGRVQSISERLLKIIRALKRPDPVET